MSSITPSPLSRLLLFSNVCVLFPLCPPLCAIHTVLHCKYSEHEANRLRGKACSRRSARDGAACRPHVHLLLLLPRHCRCRGQEEGVGGVLGVLLILQGLLRHLCIAVDAVNQRLQALKVGLGQG